MTHRMLLVEDDELTCSLMRRIFASKELEVVTAHSVAEALTLLNSRPDYLILDCTLPDGNGVEVLERVRADGLTIRVVVVSGWTDTGAIEGLAPDAVLSKPLDLDRLMRALGIAGCGQGEVDDHDRQVTEDGRST